MEWRGWSELSAAPALSFPQGALFGVSRLSGASSVGTDSASHSLHYATSRQCWPEKKERRWRKGRGGGGVGEGWSSGVVVSSQAGQMQSL